jgi:hypothetical protein
VFRIKSFERAWEKRRSLLRARLGKHPLPRDVTALSDHLAEAFHAHGEGNRGQSGVSEAGQAWEALVVWYLNLCLLGTHAVCLPSELCPKPISDALSLYLEHSALRSEPDVVLVSASVLSRAKVEPDSAAALAKASDIVGDNFGNTGVINLQCKTNWKDNAQIPMLWNMLYDQARSGVPMPKGFHIGYNLRTIRNLAFFGYAFVTVPTGRGPSAYEPTHMPVKRVRAMTAGNYWGHPSKNGVCSSLSALFDFLNGTPNIFPNVADVGSRAAYSLGPGNPGIADLAPFRLVQQ